MMIGQQNNQPKIDRYSLQLSNIDKYCTLLQSIQQQIYYKMKQVLLLSVLLLLALTHDLSKAKVLGKVGDFLRKRTKFGDVFLHKEHEDSEEVVLQESFNPVQSEETYREVLSTVLTVTQNPQSKRQFIQCSKGKHSQFFKFGAEHVGFIGNKSNHQSIQLQRRQDDCFKQVIVNFTNQKINNINTVSVEVFAVGRKRQFCTETYVFGTGAKIHIHSFTLRKHLKFTWKNMNSIEYSNVVTWGIHIFRLCDSLKHWLPDVIKTVQVFLGGVGSNPKIPFFGAKPPKYQQRLNVDFIEAGTGFRWKERASHFVNLSSYEVKSGDFLAITRFDGIDQIIQYGAGSHAGHSAVVLQVDGVLSVVESQDGWYWPKHGIQRNDWETWKKWALNCDMNVAVLPLTEESRRKFNVTKAAEFFKSMEGYPYGYHNFLMGWIDTPEDNLPSVLDGDFVLAMFSYLERLWQFPINRILTQALNKRLGTEHRKMQEIAYIMAQRGMTFGDLMAMPERDGWMYSDGPSYVCSSFVSAVYKAGGLMPDHEGTQMTPKDVYTLTIFDRNWKVPEKCSRNDPTLPYCQIMGTYLMELPHYSTIEPYAHMAEHCPTVLPDFVRPERC